MKKKQKPLLALIYDFDSTLAVTDMQAFKFIPSMGMSTEEFWEKTNEEFHSKDMDRVLCYLYMMVRIAKEKNIPLTREFLNSCGDNIEYFNGVTDWFDRINEMGKNYGVQIEHYVISCGNLEIIEKCSIAKYFKNMFACEFIYDDDGVAIWPKTAINYTGKTQYIYRINKGLTEDNSDQEINEKTHHKRIPMDNMIYIGDGLTDVPAMITVKESGGTSIAVYKKGKRDKVNSYYEDNRVNYICEADYSKGSNLEKIVKLIIKSTAIKETLKEESLKAVVHEENETK